MFSNKFLIIGGDLRNISLANHLIADGKRVKLFGFNKGYCQESFTSAPCFDNLQEALQNVEVVLGPMPCCSDNNLLNMPFHDSPLSVQLLFQSMNNNQLFIAGFINDTVIKLANKYSIPLFDVLKRNEMAILNAIPTAEGAIQIAIEQMKITLHNSNAMVLGYGRIGKILCKMLQGIGANIHVVVRKHDDAASIKSFGYIPLYFEQLTDYLGKMDVIFNTVPSTILDKNNLKYIAKDCVIIELASKPFGIDYEASKKEGLNVMWASSLPGKVAPITAAKYIQETVYNIINSWEG